MSKVLAKVPTRTSPMAKFYMTTEGILVIACNIALLVVPIVTSAVSPHEAIKLGAELDGVAMVARTVLKALVALGVPTTLTDKAVVGDVDKVVQAAQDLIPILHATDAPLESSAKAAPAASES